MTDRKTGLRTVSRLGLSLLAVSLAPFPAAALQFDFSSIAGSLTGFTPQAEAALDRAAQQWTSRINDPITVYIKTEFQTISNPSVIGTAGSVFLVSDPSFSGNVIQQMQTDAAAETDDGIVAYLPNIADLQITLPNGIGFVGHLSGTKANFKALGFAGLDTQFGLMDAVINFNLGFNFDFDNSDGISPGYMDFETVAAHELGHALGFVSAVDDVDYLLDQGSTGTIAPTLLDLFRFGPDDNPSSPAEFSTAARNLVPGVATFFDDTMNEYLFSTGVTQGDGRQASHWKDTNSIGILDPTLGYGQIFEISAADLRALDLMGYDIATVPLPPAVLLFGSGLILIRRRLGLSATAQERHDY